MPEPAERRTEKESCCCREGKQVGEELDQYWSMWSFRQGCGKGVKVVTEVAKDTNREEMGGEGRQGGIRRREGGETEITEITR